MRAEVHPGEGGDDAVLFASELSRALAAATDGAVRSEGRVVIVESPRGL